ncbi:MAG: hypothetical protein WB493_08560 [Anaeromyxobacteraceae bacterium]
MAELKTQRTGASVAAFIDGIPDAARRADARAAAALLRKVTGSKAEMWGANIVGFGRRRMIYESGRELDWMVAAFAPRGDRTTFYLTCDLDRYGEQLGRLGKHQRGKGCLHVKRLSDVDAGVLEELVRCAVAEADGAKANGAKANGSEADGAKAGDATGADAKPVSQAARPARRAPPRSRSRGGRGGRK